MFTDVDMSDSLACTKTSEILRDGPAADVAPYLWRMMDGGSAAQLNDASTLRMLEQKFHEGKQRGFTEALAAARREAETKAAPVIERLTQSIADLAGARQRMRDEAAEELVKLAVAIASRIINREVTLDPDAIHGLLRAAFGKAQAREVSRILMHPAQEPAVRRFLSQTSTSGSIEIATDARLANGSILFETSQGQLDASIDTQLKEIERGLADSIQG